MTGPCHISSAAVHFSAETNALQWIMSNTVHSIATKAYAEQHSFPPYSQALSSLSLCLCLYLYFFVHLELCWQSRTFLHTADPGRHTSALMRDSPRGSCDRYRQLRSSILLAYLDEPHPLPISSAAQGHQLRERFQDTHPSKTTFWAALEHQLTQEPFSM